MPLPFLNDQDDTLNTDNNNDVNIKCPKESLLKGQFTMHIFFNTGTGKQGYIWCGIFCKGIGNWISQAEKELWYDDHIDIFWQNNSRVDSEVTKDTKFIFSTKISLCRRYMGNFVL